jgi:hypothetical protein
LSKSTSPEPRQSLKFHSGLVIRRSEVEGGVAPESAECARGVDR